MKSEERKIYEKAYKKAYAKSHRQITITVDNQQYSEFAQKAKSENTKVSTLVKNMAIAYSQKEIFLPSAVEKELSELKYLIRNVANNVNQMAHHSNMLNTMVEEQDLLLELKRLEDLVVQHTNQKYERS